MRTVLCLGLAIFGGSAPEALAADTSAKVIETWTRGGGATGGHESPRERMLRVDLEAAKPGQARRFDAQYGKRRSYRGVPLTSLMERYKPSADLDLAVLHFANGMAIPVPFRDEQVMARLEPFVAIGEFPAITPAGGTAESVRPIQFVGNKLVVRERWHPSVAPAAQTKFSPWDHTDSLVGIELVDSGAYYRQFDVAHEPKVQEGLALFKQTCQFCHGARKVGAKFGWDFVEPYPLSKYRKPETRLYYHIAFNPWDTAEKGIRMPALSFMTEADAAAVWKWLEAVGSKPMPPYVSRGSAKR